MSNKEKYREFYKSHPDMCVFSAPWWLDAVAGDTWDVILIEEGGSIIASFPYVCTKGKLGIKKIELPPLTQKLGPYILYDKNISYTTKIGYEHKIYQQIIDALPAYDVFNINFDQQYKNWLPFYWNGFSQSTRYSYQLVDIKHSDKLYGSFAANKKQRIRKAAKDLVFKTDLSIEGFYNYFSNVIKRREDSVSFSFEIFSNIYKAAYAHNQGKTCYCIDNDEHIHAIAFIVWDRMAAYYLIAMRDAKYNSSGGTEFLIYEMIKYVSQFVDVFDFEGSMLEGVEQSFRYFNAQQTEYYSISKINNKLLKLYRALRS